MSIELSKELSDNFLDYTYEFNSERAFPSAVDGLKPGQRACLWEMYTKGFKSSKPHVKSAKVSGGTIATWWPHGNTAIYETFVRMSQPWINNICEVDFHGANGNVYLGPAAASERYTEVRLSKASEDGFFSNINKNTVDMILNFSEDEEWPSIFPAIFPRLFVNGSQGIGSTISNTWCPNNLNEFTEVLKDYLTTGEIDYNRLAPDFPSGGIIINKNDLPEIYRTGKGKVVLRGKYEIKGKNIFITELPYQVYVEPFIDEVKELIKNEEINTIKAIYNKSDKKGILIDVECTDSPEKVVNFLLGKTNLQRTISPNQWALVGKTPTLLNFKDYIDIYLSSNKGYIKRETKFDLDKAFSRKHIVDGLLIAIEDIDNVIALIKNSKSSDSAKDNLIKKYSLSEEQAKAIVSMKLGSLANVEKIELETECKELVNKINNYNSILSSEDKITSLVLERLEDFTKKYGYERRTEVTNITIKKEDKEIANVVPEKCVVITSEDNTIRRVPATSFKVQRRAGKGIKTLGDITRCIIRTNTVDNLMVFSSKAKMYRLLVDQIPQTTKGTSIKSLVAMDAGEEPTLIYSIYRDTDAEYVLFVTKNGQVKKTKLEEYTKVKRKGGIIATNIKDRDALASVSLIKDEQLFLITKQGMCIRFKSSEIPSTGRASAGVKGINLAEGDEVIACLPIRDKTDKLAIFLANGKAKKIDLTETTVQGRAGKGVLCAPRGEEVAGACLVAESDEVLISGQPNSLCVSAKDIPTSGRATSGNIMIKDSRVISVSKV